MAADGQPQHPPSPPPRRTEESDTRRMMQELETMKQRLKEMEDETNKLTAPAEGSDEGKITTFLPRHADR